MSSPRPGFTAQDAQEIARELYGFDTTASQLPGYIDQNFLLERPSGHRFVLKISRAAAQQANLDLQVRVLEHVAAASFALAVPRPVKTLAGAFLGKTAAADGQAHFVHLLSWIDGTVWAARETEGAELLRSLGRHTGRLDTLLEDFSHPAMDHEEAWDLQRMGDVRGCLDAIEAPARRRLIEGFLDHFDDSVAPRLARLPKSVIHNDVNNHNVLLDAGGKPTGLLDFGDVVYTQTLSEVAIAMAYAMLDCRDPAAAGGHVLDGYRQVRHLSEEELDLVPDLAMARLAMSVTYAAHNLRRDPSNSYLGACAMSAWQVIEAFPTFSPAFSPKRSG